MGRVKNKKRNLSENINNRKSSDIKKKKLNPFEVHINKEKIRVLGKKLKHGRGMPGISRAKAIEKRKHTLLPEYAVRNKSNLFLDNRLGEHDKFLTDEEKAIARFAAVRARQHKKSIFNLADDEILTHKGQTLSEIEKFEDPCSDNEEDDELPSSKAGALDSKFVDEAHFGGGMLRKPDQPRTHKELIEQLIVESKKRKAEKQKEKEVTVGLTEKLDTEWRDLLPIINKSKKNRYDIEEKTKGDTYDRVVAELIFEARGVPSTKLKSEEDVVREEKEKLERLEAERLKRMKGCITNSETTMHRSADDLDDNFEYDDVVDGNTLSYNEEGKCQQERNGGVHKDREANESDSDDEDGEEDEEEGEGDGEEEEEEEEGDDESNEEEDDESNEEDDDDESNEDEDDESIEEENDEIDIIEAEEEDDVNGTDKESECEDNLSDLKESENDASSSEEEVEAEDGGQEENDIVVKKSESSMTKKKEKEKKILQENDISMKNSKEEISEENTTNSKNVNNQDEIRNNLLLRKELMDKARNEVPYTFSLPEDYESLQKTLKNQSGQHQSVIIERMIKCNHPSLNKSNKEGLAMLFAYILQHINDVASEVTDEKSIKECFNIFSCIVPQLYDLAHQNPENCHSSILEVIKEKQSDSRSSKRYPEIDVLLFLKLISCLFSTSDFKHAVVSPSVVFMEQLLKCKVKSRRDVAYGLFIVGLIAEFTTLSKRYVPAAISFLNGVLHMAIPKSTVRLIKVLPPFKSISTDLVLNVKVEEEGSDLKLNVTDLLPNIQYDDLFRLKTVHTAICLLDHFFDYFTLSPICIHIFETSIQYLNLIPKDHYGVVGDKMKKFVSKYEEFKSNVTFTYLVMEKNRPKALRLYEPNIERVTVFKNRRTQSKEKADREKLIHKIKREKKGAVREIRRDKAFIGRIKLQEKFKSDTERKEKVKNIYREASIQQCEYNSMQKKNPKKK